jgi:hypothetical protein
MNSWLRLLAGNRAFVFAGKTTYDTSFFGDPPGGIVTATRLFIVDAVGTFTPLTEAPPAPSRTATSEADRIRTGRRR